MDISRQLNKQEYLKYIEKWKEENKELIESGKCRKVFLECLPKRKTRNNWEKCVSYNVYFIYEDMKDWIEIKEYISNKYIRIKYENNEINILIGGFLGNRIGAVLGKISRNYKYKIGEIVNSNKSEIKIISQMRMKNNQERGYKYECLDCGNYGVISENNLNNGFGCNNHIGEAKKGINDISTTHPHLVKYFSDIEDAYKYSYSSGNEVLMKCPDCGGERKMRISSLSYYGFSCKKCGDGISYPEKIMFNILGQLEIEFEAQLSKTTFNWIINDYKYDFYFEYNKEQYIIETHGLQHYEECIGYLKNKLTEIKANDKLKKELALNNGIKEGNYIVVDCRNSTLDWIKNSILDSNLNKLFDLDTIDWLKVDEFASKNIIKEICMLWKNGINDTLEISKIMKIARSTIINYLNKGSKIWSWCTYDGQSELKKGRIKAHLSSVKVCRKQTEVYKDGVSLGIFESTMYIERHSEELFGIKLFSANITKVCRGERKTTGGFEFKYV